MSFVEQERAMFDLLFDAELRNHFLQKNSEALADYDLTAEEKHDFDFIRHDALEIDAKMRVSMVVSYLCKYYPLSCSILSSFIDGLDILRSLISPQVMKTIPPDRPVVFGRKLAEKLGHYPFDSDGIKNLTISVMGAEFHMAKAASELKKQPPENGDSAPPPDTNNDSWFTQPITLADHLSAITLPLPYNTLKNALCPVSHTEIWRYRLKNPLLLEEIDSLSVQHNPTLLVTRAYVSHQSRCDSTIEHHIVELSEGFASLLPYINGSLSVDNMLYEMQHVGASDDILQGIKNGFQQLYDSGMITITT